jgi:EmrB/QacA subfamily drug resistance transporter
MQETHPAINGDGRWILAATIFGSSMAFIDGTAVNVALPVLQEELNATVAGVQWVIESYTLFLAALILVGGTLGDRFGRRRIFAFGVMLFAGASVWCGLSPDVDQLIVARAAQGVGGALLIPGSLAIISAYFPKRERGRAIGTWSAFTAITAAVGPLLGGALAENVSWRWIFFINIPLAVVVLSILFLRVPESRDHTANKKLDLWGAFLATIGLGALVYGFIESANLGWNHPIVVGTLAGGAAALIAFVFVEARSPAAMMPLALFRSRTFGGANLITLLLYAALGASMFFFPFNLIQVQNYSATAAGAALLPLIILIFLLSRWAGGLVSRRGARPPLVAGPIIAAFGYVLLALPGVGGSYWKTFFPGVLVLGLGMAISIAPLTTTVMSALDESKSGLASGINNALSRVAWLISIAVMGILVLHTFNAGLDRRLETIEIPPEARQIIDQQRIRLAGAEIPPGLNEEKTAAVKDALAHSFVSGFRLVTLISAALALACGVIALLILESRKPEAPEGMPIMSRGSG